MTLKQSEINLMYKIKAFIEETDNFEFGLTTEYIVSKFKISIWHLKFVFKVVYGISVSDFIIESKMKLAHKLLTTTDRPIKEIVWTCGYATKQSFLNAVKKYYGSTPGKIRKDKVQIPTITLTFNVSDGIEKNIDVLKNALSNTINIKS